MSPLGALPTDALTVWGIAQLAAFAAATRDDDAPPKVPDWAVKYGPFDRCICGHLFLGHERRPEPEDKLNPCTTCGCGYFELLKMPYWLADVDTSWLVEWRTEPRQHLYDLIHEEDSRETWVAGKGWIVPGRELPQPGARVIGTEPAASPQVAEDVPEVWGGAA